MSRLAENRRALHDYLILEKMEAGLALQGWEVKAIRAGQVQLRDSYVVISRARCYLLNAHITPLSAASSHVNAEPTRSRPVLLHKKELRRLIGKIRERRLTLIPLNLHLTRGKIKADIALAQGKKKHDKRRAIEERDWKRQQGRLLRRK